MKAARKTRRASKALQRILQPIADALFSLLWLDFSWLYSLSLCEKFKYPIMGIWLLDRKKQAEKIRKVFADIGELQKDSRFLKEVKDFIKATT